MASTLNTINYLNAAASVIIGLYTLNIEAGPGMNAYLNIFSMRDFPRQFEQGSMTPAEPFFVLFNIIAMFLCVFAIVQLLPTYRASPMVQEGVGYLYAVGTLCQFLANTIGRGDGFLSTLISTIFYGGMAGCIWKILNNQAHLGTDGTSEEYWILRFPFSLQAGWSIALTLMSANTLFELGSIMHVIIVIASLAAYVFIPVKLLFLNGDYPNYIVPAFLSLITVSAFYLEENTSFVFVH